jgi:hypothetical protein
MGRSGPYFFPAGYLCEKQAYVGLALVSTKCIGRPSKDQIMASWLRAAGDLLEAVDRTAQKVSTLRDRDEEEEVSSPSRTEQFAGEYKQVCRAYVLGVVLSQPRLF